MARVEDNVENLVARLEGQGKKVKILSEEEEAEEAAAKQRREEAMAQKVEELKALEQEKAIMNEEKAKIDEELYEKEKMLEIEQ